MSVSDWVSGWFSESESDWVGVIVWMSDSASVNECDSASVNEYDGGSVRVSECVLVWEC